MEIGKKLFISEGTVKILLHNIYQKLGADSRTKLAATPRKKDSCRTAAHNQKSKRTFHHEGREACPEQRRREHEVKKLKCNSVRILRALRALVVRWYFLVDLAIWTRARLAPVSKHSTSPTLHYSITPAFSIFRYISNSTEKCIFRSIVFSWDHWHPAPHCGRGWRFRGETERTTL
jgi:Bacterial regulatory proteins, luxR family